MSSESQLQLGAAVPTFKLLMLSWEKLATNLPRLKLWIDHALGWVYDYYRWMDNRDVYILAMCKWLISYSPNIVFYFETVIDPATCFTWIKCAWGAEHVMKAEELVLGTVGCCLNTLCTFTELMTARWRNIARWWTYVVQFLPKYRQRRILSIPLRSAWVSGHLASMSHQPLRRVY